ncbi:MAG: acyl carrier protein [Thermodesulfobacteriota bacterium]|nr:MAG: acyl carrier protein [Thermodesulfobacteriota bacterium]
MDVKEKVKNLLIELFEIDPDEIKDDVELYSGLGLDSTETVELILAIEKLFGINIMEKEITKFSCFKDIDRVIQGKLLLHATV